MVCQSSRLVVMYSMSLWKVPLVLVSAAFGVWVYSVGESSIDSIGDKLLIGVLIVVGVSFSIWEVAEFLRKFIRQIRSGQSGRDGWW